MRYRKYDFFQIYTNNLYELKIGDDYKKLSYIVYIVEVTSNISNAYLPLPPWRVGESRKENTMKNAKEYLMGIKNQRKYIECLERDVEWLEKEMTAINSPFGHAGGGTHKPEAGFESIVARKMEKEQMLEEAKAQLAELLLDADRAIDAISDLRARLVLKMYYLEDKSTADIARLMFYSKQHVNRLMNKGYQLMVVPEEKIPA